MNTPDQNYFFGCNYCKYAYECFVDKEEKKMDLSDFNMIKLMWRFGKITGVSTGPLVGPFDRMFYIMSMQELYPEKARKFNALMHPKDLKAFKKLEKKYINREKKNSKKADKYARVIECKGIWKFALFRKPWLFVNKYLAIIKKKSSDYRKILS